jgi:hypothetical protein
MAFSFESNLLAKRHAESELRAHFTARFFVYVARCIRLADGNETGQAMRSYRAVAGTLIGHSGMELDYASVNTALCRIVARLGEVNLPAAGFVHSHVCYAFRGLTLAEQQRTAQILEEYYNVKH